MQPQDPIPQDQSTNEPGAPETGTTGEAARPVVNPNPAVPAVSDNEEVPAPQPNGQDFAAQQYGQPEQPQPQDQQSGQPVPPSPPGPLGQSGQFTQPGPDEQPPQNLADQYFGAPPGQQIDPPKKSKRALLLFASIAALLIIAIGVAVVIILNRATPDSVFKAAVGNSLSTKSVKQSLQSQDASLGVIYDFSKAGDPRVDAHTNISIFGSSIDVEQYATLSKGYITYNNYGGLFAASPSLAAYKGKWMQQRSGSLANTANADNPAGATVDFPDAGLYLFGDWIFGNFSAKDRTGLENYIVNNKVYGYEAAKVTKKQVKNEACYVYTITADQDKLLELNKKAAAIWGVSADAAQTAVANDSGTKYTIYIGIKSKHLVQVEAPDTLGSGTATDTYSDYDAAKIPAEPTVQADISGFNKAIDQVQSF